MRHRLHKASCDYLIGVVKVSRTREVGVHVIVTGVVSHDVIVALEAVTDVFISSELVARGDDVCVVRLQFSEYVCYARRQNNDKNKAKEQEK